MQNPVKAVRQLSRFLGCNTSEEELKSIVDNTTLQSMKSRFNNSKSHVVSMDGNVVDGSVFMRKGELYVKSLLNVFFLFIISTFSAFQTHSLCDRHHLYCF